jgi:hemolysin activation/secretion protein
VRGFDALEGTEDVATGVQFGAIAGRSVPWFGKSDNDLFLAADFYAGLGSATSFAALRVGAEARHDLKDNRWDSMISSGRVAWYVKPSAAYVLIGSGELSGGWHTLFPFQLRLGDRDGGVRGYSGSRVAGAVRSVGRVEARRLIGRFTRYAAVGIAGFADAGRVWAGEAPFGVDSRMKVGVGMGLLAAIPPQSRQLWRLDVAVPVSADPNARWEIRLTATRARDFWREPNDVMHARAGAASSTIFTWP